MEYVILGFLQIKDLSQYDILKALEQRVSPFYSASLGSIQTTLKKLERLNMIACTKRTVNGRAKNVYSINDAGIEHFITWMMSDIKDNKFDVQMSAKVFFLGLLDKEQRESVVEGFISHLKGALEDFNAVKEQSANKSIDDKYKDIAYFQLKTLDMGLSGYENMLKWCEQLLEEINR